MADPWMVVMWAHSANVHGRRHTLSEHARSTGRLAERFASSFGAGQLGWALGLFHDAGKARGCWQEGLLAAEHHGGRVGVAHKDLGANLLRKAAGPAAMAVLGHHGGLSSIDELRCLNPDEASPRAEAVRSFLAEIDEASRFLELPAGSLLPGSWRSSPVTLEVGIRLAFSALVDADHLDTAAHFDGLAAPDVRPDADMAMLRDRFERNRAELLTGRVASPIDDLRERVYRRVIECAADSPGMFRMPAPTGVGKTLSAGGFGLHHAAAHGKKRVIVAVPFITVTEQNARVYRSLLGQEAVLEHHSSVRPPEQGAEERRLRSAVETWDSPFIVTTTVQLFDSLFGRKPSQMRKLHRLADAVLVLDEVQALPLRVLTPILDVLRTLCAEFGTTVLLTSATQPSFHRFEVWGGLGVRDVVDEPGVLFARLRRVQYRWWLDPKPTLSAVGAKAAQHDQVLFVVNTVADARRVYQQWAEAGLDAVFHLSTRMYPDHRRRVLDHVRALLCEGKPVRVVSTQLIEAGVDVDFPVVYRAFAPAESLQQAAGRANREGRRTQHGLVVVFDAEDTSYPAGYRLGMTVTRELFGPQGDSTVDPDNLKALDEYYRILYKRSNAENGPRAATIQASRGALDFEAVTDGPRRAGRPGGTGQGRDRSLAFRMLDDDTVPVVVTDHDPDGRAAELLRELQASPERIGRLVRELQPFVVALPRKVLEAPAVAALCSPIAGDLHEWRGRYHEHYGIDTSDLHEEEVW